MSLQPTQHLPGLGNITIWNSQNTVFDFLSLDLIPH